jgi:hypothetical protein
MLSRLYKQGTKESNKKISDAYTNAVRDYQIARYEHARYKADQWKCFLMEQGKQWEESEQLTADKKGLRVLTYNILAQLIRQKNSLMVGTENVIEFAVEKEGLQGSETSNLANIWLSYCWNRSAGRQTAEQLCASFNTVGQGLLVVSPKYEKNDFAYMEFKHYPFYRYQLLGWSDNQYWNDASGVALIDIKPFTQAARDLELSTEDEIYKLYHSRFTGDDLYWGRGMRDDSSFDAVFQQSTVGNNIFGSLNTLFNTDTMKDYVGLNQHLSEGLYDNYKLHYKQTPFPVLTMIEREELPRDVVIVEKTDKVYQVPEGAQPDWLKKNPPPFHSYLQRSYFDDELSKKIPKTKESNLPSDVDTLNKIIELDEKNGYARVFRKKVYCIRRREFYGKYAMRETVFPTDVNPYVPATNQWTNDPYGKGDVHLVSDLQRMYNERKTLQDAVARQQALGDKTIYNEQYANGDVGTFQSKLNQLAASEVQSITLDVPLNVDAQTQPLVLSKDTTRLDPQYIQDTELIPTRIREILGITSFMLGEPTSASRTSGEAAARSNFGSSKIKMDAMRLFDSIAEAGKIALTYTTLLAGIDFKIRVATGQTQQIYTLNGMVWDDNTMSFQIQNELFFDTTLLRVAYKDSLVGKNTVLEQKIQNLIRMLPQNNPALPLMAEALILLQEEPLLNAILEKSNMLMDLNNQLKQAQDKLRYMERENELQTREITNKNITLEVFKKTTSRMKIVSRRADGLMAEINKIRIGLQANAKIMESEARMKIEDMLKTMETEATSLFEDADGIANVLNTMQGDTQQAVAAGLTPDVERGGAGASGNLNVSPSPTPAARAAMSPVQQLAAAQQQRPTELPAFEMDAADTFDIAEPSLTN